MPRTHIVFRSGRDFFRFFPEDFFSALEVISSAPGDGVLNLGVTSAQLAAELVAAAVQFWRMSRDSMNRGIYAATQVSCAVWLCDVRLGLRPRGDVRAESKLRLSMCVVKFLIISLSGRASSYVKLLLALLLGVVVSLQKSS